MYTYPVMIRSKRLYKSQFNAPYNLIDFREQMNLILYPGVAQVTVVLHFREEHFGILAIYSMKFRLVLC